jgi:hypothetical protein
MTGRLDHLKGARERLSRYNLSGHIVFLESRPFINRVGIKDTSTQAERAIYRYLMEYTGKVTVFDRF